MDKVYYIKDVAKKVGVSSKTLLRWEESGKIRKPGRDFRGWRVYSQNLLDEILAIRLKCESEEVNEPRNE